MAFISFFGLSIWHWWFWEIQCSITVYIFISFKAFYVFLLYLQDIDTIYLSLNTKELNIQDFDHLEHK